MKPMSMRKCRWIWVAPLLATLLGMGACEREEYDHEPPAGQGALAVSNFTGDRVRVYIDGLAAESVAEGKVRYYDLIPGVHRVALDSDDNEASWAGDADILAGRLTVMEVRTDYYGDEFDVRMYFD